MQLRQIQNAFFLGLVALTTLAFLGLIWDFLQPVFWSTVLATLFQPVYEWWKSHVKGWSSVASVLTVITIIVMVILPLFFVSLAIAQEATSIYDRIASGEIRLQAPIEFIEQMVPLATEVFERWGLDPDNLRQRLSNAAVNASRTLATQVWAVGQNAARFAVQFFLMVYLLFFFLRDGGYILQALEYALPLGDDREEALFGKFAEVARATIKGTLVVGIVQGTLGGVIFWLLGIQAAILWGVVMTVLSLLPAVGAALVWAPAAAILILTGSTAKGLVLLVFGTLIIGLADNVLRPLLVGRDTQMPDYLVLVATLGGLTLFGISGFVIGPIIAALFLTVWQMFGQEFGTDPPSPASQEASRQEASRQEASRQEAPRQ
jgi:predicted PurR-regulated permease PerM